MNFYLQDKGTQNPSSDIYFLGVLKKYMLTMVDIITQTEISENQPIITFIDRNEITFRFDTENWSRTLS